MENPLASDLNNILTHTKGLWDEVRGQRLFITGGTGFLGCWLLESFAWANDKLGLGASTVILSRNPDTFRRKAPHLASNSAIKLHEGDVRSFSFPEGAFSHIIHAATQASAKVSEEDPLLMLDTIIQGTRHTLEFARQCGGKKFLLTSSGAVYGKQPSEITHIPEDYEGAPSPVEESSAYGEGKRAAELLCSLYAKQYGLEVKIARCFAFVGPYLPLDIHFAIGNFIRDGFHGGPIYVKGNGTPYRSYLYAADLAIWLWTILFRGESCRPYNVGSEDHLNIEAVAKTVAEEFGPEIEIKVAQPANPHQPSERYVPCTQRAQTELNLRQYVNLHQAIKRTITWYSQCRANLIRPDIKLDYNQKE